MGNFSIHDISPIIVNLVEDSDSDLVLVHNGHKT
jgi:hypothetical protein